jgi:amino acid adenylation domain-containing protein/thioester reductase-like protein
MRVGARPFTVASQKLVLLLMKFAPCRTWAAPTGIVVQLEEWAVKGDSSINKGYSGLSTQQAKALEQVLERRRKAKIARQSREFLDGRLQLPVSMAQQRLWFFDQLHGSNSIYNIPLSIRLRGELNERALCEALDALIMRHEVFRSVLLSVAGEARQEISAEGRFHLELIDLSDLDGAQREVRVSEHERAEADDHFDLPSGPLIRGRLLKLHDTEHVLLVTMHHIISDGWSTGIFMRELTELYTAFQTNASNPLAPLAIQYADYAQWQRDWLQGRVLEEQLSYWRSSLAHAPTQIELPTDRARPVVQSYRGQHARVVIDAELSWQLRALAKRHGMTLFMVLCAAWSLYLSRISGQQDVVIGTPMANRRRPGVEDIIGFFVNMVPLRLTVGPDLALRELFAHVKEVTLGAYDHQDVPFEQLVEAIKPERTLSRHPIFQVAFVLQNAPRSELSLPGLSVYQKEIANEAAKFDLQLVLQEHADEIAGTLGYATDLFDAATIERWVCGFVEILQRMVRNEHGAVHDLFALSSGERERIIEHFNRTDVAYPHDHLLHELFEARAVQAPHAPAVTFADETLTYQQLNQRANRLAHYLRAQGVGPDVIVGLCLERSIELIVGLLGVLKAGGAYMPLDPHYPIERLLFMLEDAQPRLLLTQERLKAKLPVGDMRMLALDSDWSTVCGHEDHNPDPHCLGLTPQHLANVIYTSGSTGRPKGVMVTHRGVCNLATTHNAVLDLNAGDRVLQFSSLSFDAFTWEWSAAFNAGACLHMATREDLAPGEPLLQTLKTRRITHVILAPVVLGALPETETLPDLRTIISGGDVCTESLVRRWARGRKFINGYGPTEISVCAAMHICDVSECGNPPIGKPLSNTQIYILDDHQRPVPIGVLGELYIAGAGLTRGYLHRAELSAERFLANPFGPMGSRMYRTGDLGRWRADGSIEYHGRNDHQVKLRGLRIELGEIEAQLKRHPAVKEGTVIVREDVPGDKRLVAYVVVHRGMPTDVESLRAHLQSVLPEFMVPNAFVMLERLPVTANAKLDRHALPAPDESAYVRHAYEAPVGLIEEAVAGVWQALLRVERVGRGDNFFALGGHSLLIVQMMERLRRLGLVAEARDVFESQSLADLAMRVQGKDRQELEVPPNLIAVSSETITPEMLPLVELSQEDINAIVAVVPGGARNIEDIYALAPLQEGILFHHLMSESGDAYVLPRLFVVASRERLDELIAALQTVIDRHAVLRSAILWDRLPRPVQVVYRQAPLPVIELTLDGARDVSDQLKHWSKPEVQRLDIRKAPLLRLTVAKNPQHEREWYALLQLHHITIDHVALQIITTDIVTQLQGESLPTPSAPPYRNHVARALAYARKHDADDFFSRKLGDVEEPTAPFGLINVNGDGTHIDAARLWLDGAVTQRLRVNARRRGVSPAVMFHAAWALVVAHTSRREDVVFGSVFLGRMQVGAGTQKTLGMFINTLPLRLKLSDVSALQLIELTQQSLVELLTHEQASLSKAQRCSGMPGGTPLFSSLLNFRHSVPNAEGDWNRVTGLTALPGQERTNYPITVSIDELGDAFSASALTDRSVDPQRVIKYLYTAMESLLNALETAPQTPALALDILPESERRELIEAVSGARVSYADARLVHHRFEEWVEQHPSATALVNERLTMSYAQLNARANRLARWLKQRGVNAGMQVALCFERSFDMIAGVLAIVKAGAAYLPLDPSYPAERLRQMLEDARPRLVLAHEKTLVQLPEVDAEVIDIGRSWEQIAAHSDRNLTDEESGLRPEHPIYVIYTSGSTGRPKGTLMGHRSMVNLIEWHRRHQRLGRPQRVLQFAALSFDVAFQEIFSTLCTGGTLVLTDESTRRDARALLDLITQQHVERLFLPPLMLQSLAECFDAEGASMLPLKDVICAGEQLKVGAQIAKMLTHADECQLHNHYGPTETHVVTALELDGDPRRWPELPSIGRPLDNTQVYVLGDRQQPLAFGVTGEMYLGGANVALGYLHRPELTAQRFVTDPFAGDGSSRMYRTGDLGRFRRDGTIEYLGRSDDQVKIRGYRIELGEIEAVLKKHPAVREAAVVARSDASGGKRLIGYVTTGERAPEMQELRAFLKAQLADYMVPGVIVILDEMPLTPTGKLNRRALPEPGKTTPIDAHYEAPQGALEEGVAEVWRAVLGIERVGRRDNFFNIGGHSLLALQVLLRLNQRFGRTLRVTDIYKSPTVEELAARLEGASFQDSFVDLSREALLDPRIVPARGTIQAPPKRILLTGAAGFVGRFLLRQLLTETDAVVYCLMRASSKSQARSRLKATLIKWDLWRGEFDGRVFALPGDLRLPRLGLDADDHEIAGGVDSIYHCATSMNHLETYAMAKAANVDAVHELLKLATQGRPKSVNYISTLGVFGAAPGDETRVVDETTSIDHEKYLYSQGYLASKWVAEKLFMLAAERGIACNIFRLGLVWADSHFGRFDELQHLYRMMKTCLLSGYGIEGYRYPMPPTPVDYVARAIVFLANRYPNGSRIFHVASADQRLENVFERCNAIARAALELLPHFDWIQKIKQLHQQGRSLPAVPLIESTFSLDEEAFEQRQLTARSAVNVRFDFSRTHAELEREGIIAPVLEDELLRVCLQDMLARDVDLREWAQARRYGGAVVSLGRS